MNQNNIKTVSIKINNGFDFQIVKVNLDFTGRTAPRLSRYCVDGEFYFAHCWEREDGRIDSYQAVYQEALTNGLN